jgi:hypothetical protein
MPPLLAASDFTAPWKKGVWNGEPAWSSTHDGVLAVVSETRSRLIYLGAADGAFNILSAPVPAQTPASKADSPNWGGHRFWLGPQKRWIWPPLTEWEHSAAARVHSEGNILFLQHKRIDPSYPEITREYAWEKEGLRCTARWKDDGRPYYGMHVVAVPTPFQVHTRRLAWSEVPDGVVDVQMDAPRNRGLIPHPSLKVEASTATVTAGIAVLKAGFVPQPLEAKRPNGWSIRVSPGPNEGTAITSPDFGYLSQVWVGGPKVELSELEQLTPYLLGDKNGWCSSTIFISATRSL